MSTCQTNSHLVNANFSPSEEEKNLSKDEYVRVLAKELIENKEQASEKNAIDENSKNQTGKLRRRVEQYELLHLLTGRGK